MSTIHLDPAIDRRLEALANATGKQPADIVHEALAAYLEDLEDAKTAEEILARLERGEEGTVSLEDLEKHLGLDR